MIKTRRNENEAKEMKSWVVAIVKVQPRLEDMVRLLMHKIERHSKDMTGDTFSLCEKILLLADKKRRLCNLKVIFERITKNFSSEEKELFEDVVGERGLLSEKAREKGVNRSTMLRRFEKLTIKAGESLLKLGFDKERLEKDYVGLLASER